MKKLLPLLLGLALVGCRADTMESEVSDSSAPKTPMAGHDDDGDEHDDDGDESEVEIGLDELPEIVKAAAQAAVPGIVLEEAVKETEDGAVVYDVEGEAGGIDYEIEVAADGTVIEVEAEGDDDDDHDDHDDGHDH